MPRKTNTQLSSDLRGKLHERSGHYCEICGRWASNAHHRKNRSQGGRDVLSNLLLLCGSGTTGCHGYVTAPFKNSPLWPANAKENGWSCWRSEEPADKPVLYRGQLCRLDDDGHVYVISKGSVSNGLGLL
jgi:hypothetical protein